MSSYAALASLVQLLDDIVLHHRWPNIFRGREKVVKSVHKKFRFLEELLQDYSSKGDNANDRVEGRIKDVAYRAQDIIESEISYQICSEEEICGTENISRGKSTLVSEILSHNIFSDSKTAFLRKEFIEELKVVQQMEDSLVKQGMTSKERQMFEGLKLNDVSLDHIGTYGHTRMKDLKTVQREIIVVVQDLEVLRQEVNLLVQEMMTITERKVIEGLKLSDDSFDDIGISRHTHIKDLKMVQQKVHVVEQDLEMLQQEVDLVVQEMIDIKERQMIEGLKLNDDSLDHIGTSHHTRIKDLKMVQQEVDMVVQDLEMVQQEVELVVQDLEMMVTRERGRLGRIEYLKQNDTLGHTHIKDSKMVQQEVDVVVQDLEMVQQEVDLVVQEMIAMKERQRIEGLKLSDDSLDHIGTVEQRSNGKNTMVGFDDYLIAIRDQLCGQSSHLKVISIVGMGGIGKTTLARNTFENALILNHFDCRAWSTISQDYHIGAILQRIQKSLGIAINESLGENKSKEIIYKHLIGRRYLIIMDDVWDTRVLDDVRYVFPDDCNGSRILITTRLLNVAQFATNIDFLHELQTLDEDQSWNLFQQSVFAEKDCPLELEAIGKTIANKCHGLPLAIVIMAGILSRVKTIHGWKKIATDVSSILSKTDGHFSSILLFSYNHLPHQLKSCFLYIGVFPEDHEIEISKLIKLWIAEGFVKSTLESKSLEKIGEQCLEDLVKRNLALITKKRSNGQFKFCILHDLLRDFCRQRAFNECFFHDNHTQGYLYPGGVKNVHRMSLEFNHLSSGYLPITGKLVRSILCFDSKYFQKWFGVSQRYKASKVLHFSQCCAMHFKLSRVLHFEVSHLFHDLQSTSFLMNAISQCFHLRYLNLYLDYHEPWFRPLLLPPSISMLQNLQTLIIHSFFLDIELPPEIWKMAQLKHLISSHGLILPLVPTSGNFLVQPLECLQTLMTVSNFIFTSEAIKLIHNLIKLKISLGRRSEDRWKFYCLYNLVHLPELEELKLWFHPTEFPFVDIPYRYAFSPNLRKLSLYGCQIPWEGLTMVGSLLHLQVLKLRRLSFVGKKWEPKEGEFQCLKFLLLELLDLNYWEAKDTHFPRLEHLRINRCSCLEEIPLEIGDIPTLKFIEVFSSSSGAEDSALLIQEAQQNLGNDVLQVHVRKPW